MKHDQVAAVVLAAGKGTRMKSALPKVLHPLAGRPMILHLLATVRAIGVEKVVVVVGPDGGLVSDAVAPASIAVQDEALGTGHAVRSAREALAGFEGDVLVLYGDTPLITDETLKRMLAKRRAAPHPVIVVLGMRPAGANEYGRLVTDGDGGLDAIVEWRDATPQQRALPVCNSGVMAIDGRVLFGLLDRIGNANAKGEYYLTDIVALARADGLACAVVEGDEAELLGVNSRLELAQAEAIVQRRLREAAMRDGATLTAPETVFLSSDTKIGRDVTIGPNVVFGPGVTLDDEVEVRAFSHLEGAHVARGAVVGPFARLRPGTTIGENAHIGNFVEVKKTVVEDGAKINHLTYIGDARVGAGANVGAGTITCNYDGFEKNFTDIGAGAFIGSNSALVAPVTIGAGAIIGAGSTVTRDVPPDGMSIERGEEKIVEGGARKFRARRQLATGRGARLRTGSEG
ncbi:MAG: bifunctional UDP-N-acetylglucosamine diphosphorylase/glucosamine-1-phosphate N-acetyltransferase GlmU [Alphaproteobacteria bacterium]